MLKLVEVDFERAELLMLAVLADEDDPPHPVDAMSRELVNLSDLAQDELLGDPYSALADDGIDAYTGADTVLGGSHDHALMMAGWAMLEVDDD